ncbi:non-ribosomal peptide synthetase [Tenacibaculum agarivorans]|uniref:non-ribosomal peptide synthetase n=1 Tax=Tenacibaculum agarivorans TaxID=1908389 RepID=UPI00094B9DA7|nr:non-ribosomal peptide synthetase [Tenacibaculum agarivorans]
METIADQKKENQVITQATIHKTLPELFNLHVDKNPGKVAVRYGNYTMTYAELNAKANKIAHYIQHNFSKKYNKKISKGIFIAILGKKNPTMIASIFGVLKAGAAYVAINPGDPEDRITYLLENSGAAFLLQIEENNTNKKFPCDYLHITDENLEEYSDYPPNFENDSQETAQLIYTSGSTGTPKGVLITHQNISNRLVNPNFVTITTEDSFLQLANYAFDASTFEIFGTLLNGATLVLINQKLLFDFESLTNYIKEYGITIAFFTTSFFNAIVDQHIKLLEPIKQILFGGETASIIHTKKALEYLGPKRLTNIYGPTECTVLCTFFKIDEISSTQKNIPIGMPVDDGSIYILNEELNPVNTGEIGEICVKSLSVAKGYYKMPEKTEKVFAKGIVGENEIIYRTGDLGWINQDGIIEFIGRNDNQVKLRGYRIELDEIAYHIMTHPKVRFAAVRIKKDRKELGYIVAWVLINGQIEKKEIKDFLSTKVADYMLPRHIVFIDEIPLTSNGKLDKKKLPDPIEVGVSKDFIPKKDGSKEEKLLYALKEIFGEQLIGIDDNFFALGLDSISALHFVAESRKLNLYFLTSDIYNYPTIGELALIAKENVKKVSKDTTLSEEIRLTPIQKWFFNLNFSNPSYFQQAQIVTARSIDIQKLQNAFLNLVKSHNIFKVKFYKKNGAFVQNYDNDVDDTFLSFHSIKGVTNENRGVDQIKKEIEQQINLEKNELYKVAVIEGNDDKFYILIILHHLIVDGVSWRILVEDLIQLYQGKTISKTDNFQYWYQQLKAYAQNERTQQALPFWKRVSEQVEMFELPKDQCVITSKYSYNSVQDCLSRQETIALSKDCFNVYNTNIETLLLTAYVKSLANWMQQYKVTFMLESHGREKCIEEVDVSRTIGWFTSAYPMVITLPEDKDIEASIIAIKEQLSNVPDKGLSYGALKYMNDDTEVNNGIKDTYPEAWFNYLGIFDDEQYDLPKEWNLFDEKSGHDIVGIENQRWSSLEFNCSIVKGEFRFEITYDTNKFNTKMAEKIAADFKANLKNIITHCSTKKEIRYTPSDFELGHLNQFTFDRLFEKLNKRGTIKSITPVTGLQRGMLFHYLKNKESDQYYVQVKITISGNLQKEQLQRKLQQLIKENEIFRTVFAWEGLKEPLQCSYEYYEDADMMSWNEVSLIGKDQDIIDEEIDHILSNDRKTKFNLSQEFPLRFLLIKQDNNSYALVWTIHHILIDGWSIYHIINDLVNSFQNADIGNNFHQLKSLQFHHLTRWLNSQSKVPALKFWKEQLANIEDFTPFPYTKTNHQPSPDKPIENQQEYILKFSKQATEEIKSLAKKYEVTLNSLFHFAWAKMLHLHHNNDHIVFGVTVSGRNHDFQGIDRIVGPVINTLPVVTNWSVQHTIQEQVQSIHRTFQQINQYSYVDLNELLKMTALKTPHLFNHILVFENHKVIAKYQQNTSDIQIENIEEIEKTNYPITVIGAVENECFQIKVVYDADCFEEQMIDKMLRVSREILMYTTNNPKSDTNSIPVELSVPVYNFLAIKDLKDRTDSNNVILDNNEINRSFEDNQKSQLFIELWEKVLDQKNISEKDDFFYLGGHSLNALELSNELKRRGEVVSVNDIYKYRTIEHLVLFVSNRQNKDEIDHKLTPLSVKNEDKIFPLSPLQQRFVTRKLINRNRFNVPFLTKIKYKVSLEVINNAVTKIVDIHKSLQLRFLKENGEFKQYYDQHTLNNFCDYENLALIDPVDQNQFISEKCAEAQSKFDLLDGNKLFNVLVFDNYLDTNAPVIFFLFHHLVFDGVSLQIFINDFFKLLVSNTDKEQAKQIELSSSISYKDWVLTIQKYIANKTFATEHTYWKEILKEGGDIPTDFNPKARATHREMKAVENVLLYSSLQIEKFSKSMQKHQLMPSNFLVSVLYSLCYDFFGSNDLLIDIMSQQRESFFPNVEIERTTGFFAGAYPVRLSFSKEINEEQLMQQINQTVLDVPKNGLDYFILKYATPKNTTDELSLPKHKATVLFHYLKTENIFPETSYYEQLDIPTGFTNSKDNESNYVLNITVMESANELKIRFYYSTIHFKETTITNLINQYKRKMYHLLNWNLRE